MVLYGTLQCFIEPDGKLWYFKAHRGTLNYISFLCGIFKYFSVLPATAGYYSYHRLLQATTVTTGYCRLLQLLPATAGYYSYYQLLQATTVTTVFLENLKNYQAQLFSVLSFPFLKTALKMV